MLYFKIEKAIDKAVAVADEHPGGEKSIWTEWINRNDIRTFDHAECIAADLNERFGHEAFLAVDQGNGCYPRYDVVRAPKVGTPVSYGFNGDYYPDGEITRVGGTGCSRVYTSTGSVYSRRRKSGSWIKRGGTWCMVNGHINKLNPHF